ncbi:sensor histidine kinase [Spirosoma pollinicola]|uniref:Sensor histidine kinase n=1 Tax=Spirosoma pollinicola TaxID=2057025 RepID=A0A2K8Z8D4_9BACT|nr:histidine kinase [Spirosoma pollinicola]AUD06110.1 sensor histidine kinase [Spirosoma pollinicola]
MNKRMKANTLTLLAVITLLVLPGLYLVSIDSDLARPDPFNHEIQNLLTYFLLLLFAYLNYTVLIPRWYFSRRYGKYTFLVLVCLLGVLVIPQRVEQWVFLKPPANPTTMGWIRQIFWAENLLPPNRGGSHRPPPPFDQQGPPITDRSPYPSRLPEQKHHEPGESAGWFASPPLSIKFSLIFLLGVVSTLASLAVQADRRLRRMENDKLQTELLHLKAQIHPHFLFNTLNSIYALAIRKDDRTAETIVKLAEFMRYIISEAHNHQVSLTKEVGYIQNYLDLQRARLRDTVQVTYVVQGELAGKQIAPLVLFTFIENAFKHGVNPDEESSIRIRLTIEQDHLELVVFNKKVHNNSRELSTGIGLQNVKERLRLLYENKHQLRVTDAADHFLIHLNLTLP